MRIFTSPISIQFILPNYIILFYFNKYQENCENYEKECAISTRKSKHFKIGSHARKKINYKIICY